jgi:hypothetical protein
MDINDDSCCKLKINKNVNPITGIPFTNKEKDLKNKIMNKCNEKLKGRNIIRQRSQNTGIPISPKINSRNRDLNINFLKNKASSQFVDLTSNDRSVINIIKSPKVKKVKSPVKKVKSPVKKIIKKPVMNLNNYNYDELKNKYKNKINNSLTTEKFNKFKKLKKINKSKYVSNLTKNEFIDLIKYLKL